MKMINITTDDSFLDEINLLRKFDSDFVIKYFDHFYLDRLNVCVITEFFEV